MNRLKNPPTFLYVLRVCLDRSVTLLYANMGQVYSASLHNSLKGIVRDRMMIALRVFFLTVYCHVGMEHPLYFHDDVCIVTPPVRLRGVNGSSLDFVSG